MCYREFVYITEPYNSVIWSSQQGRPWRHAAASSTTPASICVIVTGSVAAFKCDNVRFITIKANWLDSICVEQTKFTVRHLRQTHAWNETIPKTHVSPSNAARLRFQALWSPKYISKYTSGCVSLLFTWKVIYGAFLAWKRKGFNREGQVNKAFK